MEHIKKALERAHEQRVQARSPEAATPVVASSIEPVDSGHEHASPTPVTVPPGAAQPTLTPVLPVDPDAIRRHRILVPTATGSAARAYKLLRTQVLQKMKREGLRSLAVVSADEGDGRTTAAINLGIAIGEDADHTALVVDLDLRRPAVAQSFGIAVRDGVERCLRGECDVGTLLVAPRGYRGLTLLPAAGPVAQSSELIASVRARSVLAEISARYANRIVLFDVPPLLATDDALALLPAVDAVLLVVHEGRTPRAHVERALALLSRTPVVGTVLNASRELTVDD